MNTRKLNTLRCVVLVSLGLLSSSCSPGPKSKCLIIVKEGGKAEVKSVLMGGSAANAGWRTGNIVVFRETQSVPSAGGATGKAGEVYEIGNQNELKKIGDFDPKLSDSELLSKYGKDCG